MVNLDSGMHLFASDDHGKTWYLIDTPIKPANESKVIELKDGSWMINSRVNDYKLRYIHTSSDQGKTWQSKPDPILVDPRCNASIIRYQPSKKGSKSILLFSNANSAESRSNMTVRYSEDEGETWSSGKTIYKGGSAYSDMTVLANGEVGLIFEKDDHKENVFVKFPIEYLME